MKKIILLLFVVMVGVCAYAQTPTAVTGGSCDAYSPYSCTVTVSVTAGQNGIAFVFWGSGVTDTNGDTWAQCGTTASGNYRMRAYCTTFSTTNSSEVITMTGTVNYYFTAAVEVYSGSYKVVDVTASNGAGGGTAATTPSITTGNPVELLVAGFDTQFFPGWTAGTGWTQRQNNSDILIEDKITSSAGSYSATATDGTTAGWGSLIVALKYQAPAAAAPTFTPSSGIVPQTVTLTCSTSGTHACYNTTGLPATDGASGCTTGTLYSSAVSVTTTETLYAVCGGGGTYSDSSIATANFGAVPIHRRVKSY